MQSAAHANQIRTLMVWMLAFVDLMQVSGNYVSLIVHSNIQNPTYVLPFFKISLTVVFSHSHFFAVLSVTLVILLLSPYP